jgi:hypothetical protein
VPDVVRSGGGSGCLWMKERRSWVQGAHDMSLLRRNQDGLGTGQGFPLSERLEWFEKDGNRNSRRKLVLSRPLRRRSAV